MPTHRSCCVPGCGATTTKNNDRTYHKFPNNKNHIFIKNEGDTRKKMSYKKVWMEKFQITIPPSKHHVVCSNHFLKEDFRIRAGEKTRLKFTAVPSVNLPSFNFPSSSENSRKEIRTEIRKRIGFRAELSEGRRSARRLRLPKKHTCCVIGCESNIEYSTTESFHVIPEKGDTRARVVTASGCLTYWTIRKVWIMRLKLEKRRVKGALVCSRHFIPNDYHYSDGSITLKPMAIPSLNLPKGSDDFLIVKEEPADDNGYNSWSKNSQEGQMLAELKHEQLQEDWVKAELKSEDETNEEEREYDEIYHMEDGLSPGCENSMIRTESLENSNVDIENASNWKNEHPTESGGRKRKRPKHYDEFLTANKHGKVMQRKASSGMGEVKRSSTKTPRASRRKKPRQVFKNPRSIANEFSDEFSPKISKVESIGESVTKECPCVMCDETLTMRVIENKCQVCQENFEDEKDIKCHTCVCKHVCKYCERKFQTEHTLLKHVCSKLIHACDQCPNRYRALTFLELHIRNKHMKKINNTTFKCAQCGLYFDNDNAIKDHVRETHTIIDFNDPPPFKGDSGLVFDCHHCSESFETMSDWKKHDDCICKYCHVHFLSHDGLSGHLTSKFEETSQDLCQIHSCSECKLNFFCNIALIKHNKEKHEGRTSETTLNYTNINDHVEKFGRAKYLCSQCDMGFYNRSALEIHSHDHDKYGSKQPQKEESKNSNINACKSSDELENESKKLPPLKCPHCVKYFKNQYFLDMHIENKHKKVETKSLKEATRACSSPKKCMRCNQEFEDHQAWESHSIHCSSTWDCYVCKGIFSSRDDFVNHFRRTHLKNVYEISKQSQNTTKNLKEKNCKAISDLPKVASKCDSCNFTFDGPELLIAHMSKCSKANDKFETEEGLRRDLEGKEDIPIWFPISCKDFEKSWPA